MLKVERRGFLQKLVSILLIVLTFFSVCSVRAFADGSSSKEILIQLSVQNDINNFKEYLENEPATTKAYKVKATATDVTECTMSNLIRADANRNDRFIFDKGTFDNLESKSQQAVISDLMNELKKSKYSNTATQEVSDALSDSGSNMANLLIPFVFDDVSADMATAYKWIAPFLNVIRVILGVLSIAVLLILILSTIVDCCYIGLPVAREKMSNSKDGEISKKPGYVSFDAYKTVQEAESSMVADKDYKNPFAAYFKRRTVTYIILALCLFYLVAGEMSGLISWLLSLVSGITGG